MSMIRSYRYRLYPTPEQSEAFTRWCGCARSIYNYGLEQRQTTYRDCGVSPRFNEQSASLVGMKVALPYLADPHGDVLQQALRDLDKAYRRFFAGDAGYPRYRKRGHRDSFRIQQRAPGGRSTIRVRRLSRHWGEVRVPKLGMVRFRWSRAPGGPIRNLTIKRDPLGWHVSLCCALDAPAQVARPNPPVGIDRGVTATLALSTGQLRKCPQMSPGQAKRMRHLERKASRQEALRRRRAPAERGRSARHQRTYDSLAKLKSREARIRKDFAHKETTMIAKNHGVVVIEDLRVKDMTRSASGTIALPGVNIAQKRALNRAIRAQGWGRVGVFLAYKVPAAGGTLVKINPAYTSQTCAECGAVDAASRRTQAMFVCTACGHTANADVNAARNVLAAGLAVTARGAQGEEAGALNREPPESLTVSHEPYSGYPSAFGLGAETNSPCLSYDCG